MSRRSNSAAHAGLNLSQKDDFDHQPTMLVFSFASSPRFACSFLQYNTVHTTDTVLYFWLPLMAQLWHWADIMKISPVDMPGVYTVLWKLPRRSSQAFRSELAMSELLKPWNRIIYPGS